MRAPLTFAGRRRKTTVGTTVPPENKKQVYSLAKMQAADAKLASVTARLRAELENPGECAGRAYVSFEYEAGRNKCLRAQAENTLPSFAGTTKISVKVAPEPSDIIWHNTHLTKKQRVARRVGVAFIAVIVIAVLASVITYSTAFQKLHADLNKDNGVFAILNIGLLGLLGLILSNVLCIVVLSPLLSTLEGFQTRSGLEMICYGKLAVFQFLNTSMVLIYVHGLPCDVEVTYYNILGQREVFPPLSVNEWGFGAGVFLVTSLLGDLGLLNTIDYIRPEWWAMKKLAAPNAVDQEELDDLHKGVDWMLYFFIEFLNFLISIGFVSCGAGPVVFINVKNCIILVSWQGESGSRTRVLHTGIWTDSRDNFSHN